jgi:endonuclease/exonuclease/phosphatase family metal-dependent hydrolase
VEFTVPRSLSCVVVATGFLGWAVFGSALLGSMGCSDVANPGRSLEEDGGVASDAAWRPDAQTPTEPGRDAGAATDAGGGPLFPWSDAGVGIDAGPRPEEPPEEPEPEGFSPRFRVATINAPESLREGLVMPPLARARQLLDFVAATNISISAMQESGTNLREAASARPAWRTTWAVPNNIIRGREIGNGILFADAPFRIRDQANLQVPMPGRPRGLNFPVRLMEHRADTSRRARFVMISFHAPTRRDDPDDTTRQAVRRALRAYVSRCHRVGLPVILAGDANDGMYASHFRPDLQVAAREVIDYVLVSPEIRVHGELSRSLPGLSDHHAVVATVSVPARSDAPTQLPD